MNAAEKDQTLKRLLRESPGSGVVYVATIREAERLYEQFRHDFKIGIYHGKMAGAERKQMQERFMNDEFKAMIATNAFGSHAMTPGIRSLTGVGPQTPNASWSVSSSSA